MNEEDGLLLLNSMNYLTDLQKKLKEKLNVECDLESMTSALDELSLLRSQPTYTSTVQVDPAWIDALQAIPQDAQRTPEWYEFRLQHLTASNAYKVFGSQAAKNQLIYEKCMPGKVYAQPKDIDSPLNWGQRYEPITVQLYEKYNQTTVKDFGCIAHPVHHFLAASPDGIVVGGNNYGRMIEIKNVTSRAIVQVPKPDYYVQMQLQMEVWNLDECDFVETKFVEFKNQEEMNEKRTAGQQVGVIQVYYVDSHYKYEYMPLDHDNVDDWISKTSGDQENGLVWFKTVYWLLEVYSCVLVKRQKAWFEKAALPRLRNVWETIVEERDSQDVSHRAPTKRASRKKPKTDDDPHDVECMIPLE